MITNILLLILLAVTFFRWLNHVGSTKYNMGIVTDSTLDVVLYLLWMAFGVYHLFR